MFATKDGVDDDHLGVGVVEQVRQFRLGVPVVDVDRHGPGLERGERRLEVLGAVVEVVRDLGVRADAGSAEHRRQAGGPVVELRPRANDVAVHQGGRIADDIGDRFPHTGDVEVVLGLGHAAHMMPLGDRRLVTTGSGPPRRTRRCPRRSRRPRRRCEQSPTMCRSTGAPPWRANRS